MIELTERSICHKKVRRLKDYDYTFYLRQSGIVLGLKFKWWKN
jgi:hypothetical protein